jgi:Zn finger protein HypA/HybF involved in hydrogenase expression
MSESQGIGDRKETYQAYAQCRDCALRTLLTQTMENYGNTIKDQVCEHCGSSRFDPQSVTSVRTFDPVKAKRRKVK